ncbi:MAG: acylphosphatase [Candidatus Berkelbacteria bacterium]|nr:acylphosphatase [Candidatus Berkelbacteria bacterium]
MIKNVTIKVYGLVQGVNFRYHSRLEAENLGLSGYVQNEPNGSVTIIVEGEESKLKKFIEKVKVGLSYAQVKNIICKWDNPKDLKGFLVRF